MPPKGTVLVNALYCKGCELCVTMCPQGVLVLSAEKVNERGYHPAEMSGEGCTGCGVCALVCPEAAISVYREVVKKPVVVGLGG